MSTVSTHVLDTALGQPAAGVAVRLERAGDASAPVAEGVTDANGRVSALGPGGQGQQGPDDQRVSDRGPDGRAPGTYRLAFGTGAYFSRDGRRAFHPEVTVTFLIEAGGGHYHVPLTLSPFAYSTYRGS